ncbi:hypothetical protein CBR_g23867 [Chara braunii]|uniref:Uncharacterized protein n=1 Tax=Chara braunii TaxID=69332 RepID=A0A388L590_CHABU|nr:hypothetical protein CBR_g23867 [Chara braunii]|eukprot:GBG77418.1 hypothetical protein CBR_g23867 [Chara braunii]
MPETGGASVVPKKGLTLDDLIAAIDQHERNPSNIPKGDTFHFCGERVSEWLERVEQALVGRPDVVKFQCILQYVLHSYHKEVKKVIDAAQGSWERFKEGMQRKYRLGDGLLTTTDLEAMNKEDFTTIGVFVQEFKKKARKVHGISEEAQCAFFLGLLTALEAVELTRHGGGSTKLTWATIDRGVEVGCLDQVEQRQVRLQRQKRKERDATAFGTPGVTRIVTDVLAQLGYVTEPVVQRRVVTAVKVKGKEPVIEEVGQEELWEEEEPVPQHLTKVQRKFGEAIDRRLGRVRAEAQRRAAVGPPPPAMFTLWQEKEEPPFGVEEVGSDEEVTQGLRGGSETEETIIIESDDEDEEERMEPPSVLFEKMEDLLDKMGRYQQKLVGLCKEVKGWRSNIPTVFLYDSGPESAPGRPGVNVVGSCPQPGMRGRPLTPQVWLAQAARTRYQAKTSTSQEPPRGEHEPRRRKEAVEVEDDDDEEEADERLRREEDKRAEQRTRKKGTRGEAEPVIHDGPPKKKKYAVRLEKGFDVEKVIDRLLEGHNDLMTLKEILASAPRLRDELKGRLSRRLVPNVHLGTILPKEAEWAESGTKMDWKCVACGTVDLMVKGSKCAAMVDTGAEMNIIREADAIRFGLDIDRSDCGILHGASCKAMFCGTASNVLVEVGKVKERTLMVELTKRKHRAYAFSDEERGSLDVDKIPMIRIDTVPHEPWNMRGARYPNPDEERKVVDYLGGKIRTHVADYSSGPYASPWFCFIKPDGALRWVQDLQRLNAVTVRDAGGLPNTDALSESCAGRPIISLIDLYLGYDQFPVYPLDGPVTAMHTPRGLVHMNVAPQGWTNAVAMVQRAMIRAMQSVSPHITQPYIDDLAVKGPAMKESDVVSPGDDEFEEGEIKKAFRAEEYDGIYLELGLVLSCEMRLRDASDRAQMMLQRYLVRDSHLFVKREVGNPRRVVCGRNRQIDVVAAFHDGIAGGHRGLQATYAKISELYYWDGIMDMVGKYCRSCVPCQERSRLKSDFTKTAMPRGGKGTRPPQRPLGSLGGYERHGPHHRESTPVYNDGDIELFLDSFWEHARRMGWTVAQAIERLRGAEIPEIWRDFWEQRGEELPSPVRAGFGVARKAEERLDHKIKFLAKTTFDRHLLLEGDLAGKKMKEASHGVCLEAMEMKIQELRALVASQAAIIESLKQQTQGKVDRPESSRQGEQRQPGQGLPGQPSATEPREEPLMGRVILESEEARAQRQAEREAFEFRAPTELATLPVAAAGPVVPLAVEERLPSSSSEPAQGSVEESMGVLLEAVHTMQEEVSLFLPEQRIEEPLEREMRIEEEGAIEGRLQRIITPEYGPEEIEEQPTAVPEATLERRPQRLDTPEYVPGTEDLRGRLGSWATGSGSGGPVPRTEQQGGVGTLVGSPSSSPPQPRKRKFKRKVDQLCFYCKRDVHLALDCLEFLEDKAAGKISEVGGKMYDRQGRIVEKSADGLKTQLYRQNQEELRR